jgi:hypothetical protein
MDDDEGRGRVEADEVGRRFASLLDFGRQSGTHCVLVEASGDQEAKTKDDDDWGGMRTL